MIVNILLISLLFSTIVFLIMRYLVVTYFIVKTDKWITYLDITIDQAYDTIYSKYILPFISSSITITLSSDDKYYLEASNSFYEALILLLGRTINIYKYLLRGENNFRKYVLLKFNLKIQNDMVGVVTRNISKGVEKSNDTSTN